MGLKELQNLIGMVNNSVVSVTDTLIIIKHYRICISENDSKTQTSSSEVYPP